MSLKLNLSCHIQKPSFIIPSSEGFEIITHEVNGLGDSNKLVRKPFASINL